MSREQIRQAFKSAVESVFLDKPVYTSRITDNRDDTEYVSVYIEEGDIDYNFSGSETESLITVKYLKQNAKDVELDDVAESILIAILNHDDVKQAVKRPRLTHFGYESDSTHNGLSHTFKILY